MNESTSPPPEFSPESPPPSDAPAALTDTPIPTDPQSVAEFEAALSVSKILIVDDNQQNLELLQAYLEVLPCQILTATNGLEALAVVEQVKPDVILLDIMMPRMSGFEVCKKLKADPETRWIPIIMVTALNELGDIERGVESGTDDFLTKPVNKLELITRVRSLLRIRHLKGEVARTREYIKRVEEQRSDSGSSEGAAD